MPHNLISTTVTPLHLVAALSTDVLLVQLLLNWKKDGSMVDVNAQDTLGYTPLHYALMRAHPSLAVVRTLVEGGADPFWISAQTDVTPMELAAPHGTVRAYFSDWLKARVDR